MLLASSLRCLVRVSLLSYCLASRVATANHYSLALLQLLALLLLLPLFVLLVLLALLVLQETRKKKQKAQHRKQETGTELSMVSDQ